MKMTRREFAGLAAAAAASTVVPAKGASPDGRRWYKGQLHTHTSWSDGRALPEQAVKAYKDAGFDFFAITDHNRIGTDTDTWISVGELNYSTWPPNLLDTPVFETFRRDFPDAAWRERDGKTEVRISPMTEIAARFSEPGKFLFMTGCEVTLAGPASRHLHLNYVGLNSVIPFVNGKSLIHGIGNADISATIRQVRGEVEALAAQNGTPHIFWANHPHWTYYDVLPQHLIDNPEVRFFEICNSGSSAAPEDPLPRDGYDNDRFWDAVLATRATRGEQLLYGIAVEDTHFYPGTGTRYSPVVFQDAWVAVRADELTPAALFAAMNRGDFYSTCGVEFDDIAFDKLKGRLSVSVPAKTGVAHTVKFITTKRGTPTEPVQTVELPARNGHAARTVPVYSDAVGAVAKSVTFAKGEAVKASYTLAEDDLYVRARVESDEPAVYPNAINKMHPPVKVGWTQPYRRLAHGPVPAGAEVWYVHEASHSSAS